MYWNYHYEKTRYKISNLPDDGKRKKPSYNNPTDSGKNAENCIWEINMVERGG